MKNFKQILKAAEKVTTDNSPLILTCIGVAGTLTTAYLTGRATVRATRILDDLEMAADAEASDRGDSGGAWISKKDKFKEVWTLYIPPLSVAAVTVTAIVSANRIGTRRAAALATAYTILEKNGEEYRKKIVETLGENKERAARDDIAQERATANPPSQSTVIITGKGTVPCLDLYANRWFESDYDTIQRAEIQLNKKIQHSMAMEVTLNELYDILGLPHVGFGEDVGWDADNLLEINLTSVFTDDNVPGVCMQFKSKPLRTNYRAH